MKKLVIQLRSKGYNQLLCKVLALSLEDIPYIDEIVKNFLAWTRGSSSSTFNKKIAEKLESLKQYIPKEFCMSPTNTLYRAVILKKEDFKNFKNGIPLKLKEHESWTYDLKTAIKFGEKVLEPLKGKGMIEEDAVLVLLRKKYSKNDILLNIVEFTKFLKQYDIEKKLDIKNVDVMFKPEACLKEKEILVKNKNKNIKKGYMFKKDGKWLRF